MINVSSYKTGKHKERALEIVESAESIGVDLVKLVTSKPCSCYKVVGAEVITLSRTPDGYGVSGEVATGTCYFWQEKNGFCTAIVPFTDKNKRMIASGMRRKKFRPVNKDTVKSVEEWAEGNGFSCKPPKVSSMLRKKSKNGARLENVLESREIEIENLKRKLAHTYEEVDELKEKSKVAQVNHEAKYKVEYSAPVENEEGEIVQEKESLPKEKGTRRSGAKKPAANKGGAKKKPLKKED